MRYAEVEGLRVQIRALGVTCGGFYGAAEVRLWWSGTKDRLVCRMSPTHRLRREVGDIVGAVIGGGTMIETSTPSALPVYVAWSASGALRLLCARGLWGVA